MKVGICYDLRETYLSMGYSEEETAEFDKPETVDAIESALLQSGFEVEKIGHAKQLIELLYKGKRWDIVFNICEGLNGSGREAQVPAILDVYNIPYVFSGPLVLSLCLDKALTKRVIRDLGLRTPDFHVISCENDLSDVKLPFPLFVKPVSEGTGKGITENSLINSAEQLLKTGKYLLPRYPHGILVERFLPGREFTVGILGSGNNAQAIGTMEILHNPGSGTSVYSYETKENYQSRVSYEIPEKDMILSCQDLAIQAWKGLGCLDAGRVDLKLDWNGNPSFIEVNPLAGLNPEHSDLPILARKNGINYTFLISKIMDSALSRISKTGQKLQPDDLPDECVQ
jgi:D-alanine-D-alanine ligase